MELWSVLVLGWCCEGEGRSMMSNETQAFVDAETHEAGLATTSSVCLVLAVGGGQY